IEKRDGSYYVRDLRSTLGTIVNGEPIGEHFRGDDAPLRAGGNEVIAGGVDSPFVFSVFIGWEAGLAASFGVLSFSFRLLRLPTGNHANDRACRNRAGRGWRALIDQ